ncbi:MAG: DUF4258 domain-containing protein [Candidatus ainarchaeum sp.]|nr:DUF4258 domain-containing protein [Candidatus ainarchaeum sp.]
MFSFHARQRILLRGIEESTVIYILKNPDFVEESFDGEKLQLKNWKKPGTLFSQRKQAGLL